MQEPSTSEAGRRFDPGDRRHTKCHRIDPCGSLGVKVLSDSHFPNTSPLTIGAPERFENL